MSVPRNRTRQARSPENEHCQNGPGELSVVRYNSRQNSTDTMSTTPPLKTPLYDWHVAAGGRMVDFAGWSMPVQYSSIVEEHHAVRRALGLFDISHMGRLEVAGADSAAFLDHVFTRRVIGMKAGQIRYGLVCHKDGGILDDVLVYQLADMPEAEAGISHQVVVNASNREKIVAWFGRHQRRFDVTIDDVTTKTAMIAVQGPRAIEVVEPLVNADLASMRYYTGQEANVAGHACFVSRTGYTGEDGCELIVEFGRRDRRVGRGPGAGQAVGAKPAGLGARDTLRLEAAMPLYGHELSEEITPVQAGLGFAYQLKDRDLHWPRSNSEIDRRQDAASSRRTRLGWKTRRSRRRQDFARRRVASAR